MIYTARAFDGDAENPNNVVLYGLTGDVDGPGFVIDELTGELRLKAYSEWYTDY